MALVAPIAEQVRDAREPAARDNPFAAVQENASRLIVAGLDAWRDASEAFAERLFFSVYGSPMLQAAAGIDPAGARPVQKAPKSLLHDELLRVRIADLKSRIAQGGVHEAVIRALLYVGVARKAVDERGFEAVRRIRRARGELSLPEFKALVRAQFFMLQIDAEAALAAIPSMLPPDAETRTEAFGLIKEVLSARGEYSAEDKERLQRVARLFGIDETSAAARNRAALPAAQRKAQAGAS
jgi:hypothetical protein